MLLTILNNLRQDLATYVQKSDSIDVGKIVLNHMLDCLQFQRHRLVNLKA
ncbi:hypothetical protein A2U01_0090283, partial [Trifolium medium]|nr:hypothetical protein [Trifolium medium]